MVELRRAPPFRCEHERGNMREIALKCQHQHFTHQSYVFPTRHGRFTRFLNVRLLVGFVVAVELFNLPFDFLHRSKVFVQLISIVMIEILFEVRGVLQNQVRNLFVRFAGLKKSLIDLARIFERRRHVLWPIPRDVI